MKKKYVLIMMMVLAMLVSACAPSKTTSAPKESANTEAKSESKATETKEISGKELLKNTNARKALATSFDKSYIQDVILGNGSITTDYLVPNNFAIDSDGVDFRSKYPDGFLHYNQDESKAYWEKAKQELGFTSAKLEILISDSDTSKKIAEYVQGQIMATLDNIDVVINTQPFKQRLALTKSGDFEMVLAGWGPDFADSMTFLDMWENDSSYNEGKYHNDDYTKKVMDSKVGELANKVAERTEALQEAEKILLGDDAALIPMYQRGSAYLQNPEIQGILRKTVSPTEMYKFATTSKKTDGKSIISLTASSDLITTDHTTCTDAPSFILLAQTQEGLVHLGQDGKILPGVAETWEVSPSGTEYTFHLRKNAKWQDGTPVTANDFVASWRRLANPETASQYSGMIVTARLKNGDAVVKGEKPVEDLGVVALDDYTLKVELENPVSYFLVLMGRGNFLPINEKFIAASEGKFGTTAEYSIANGPFKLKTWELGYGYSIEKNENYWDAENVKLDGVSWRVIKDIASGVNLYETGAVDVTKLSGEFVEQSQDRPDYLENLEGAMFYMIMNINR